MQPGRLSREQSDDVKKALAFIDSLDMEVEEEQHIALVIIARLEYYHDFVANSMIEEGDNKPEDVCGWAIDADRLSRCRELLESIGTITMIED
jgi:hypothetical protein